ncbi:Phosphonate ABC transporter phosphate-binding periplasmic component [Streptococcus sp. ZB199]|nr:Phosphonate ABC transporter phosphate-binding periplasmic component [Streptococcus sp. ZB199]
MKKGKLAILLAIASVLAGGVIIASQKQNIFLNDTQQRKQLSAKEKQLAYLKEHDNEIKEFVKSQNPKIESVQIDWDQTRWEDIGNGTPQGAGKVVSIFGGFNHLKTSDWNVLIEIKNGKIDMESMGISNSIRLEGQLFD